MVRLSPCCYARLEKRQFPANIGKLLYLAVRLLNLALVLLSVPCCLLIYLGDARYN